MKSARAQLPDPVAETPATPPLNQLYFYLTEGCNLACRHCWLSPPLESGDLRHPVLRVELFRTAIEEARPLGLQSVKLTGGEPLLHPEIEQILEIVRTEGLRLNIETNGTRCTADLAARIAECADPFVAVSIDAADPSTHDWMRGVRGSYDAALAGIRNLTERGVTTQIIMTLLRRNVDRVEAVAELAETLGASSVKLNILQPTARGRKLHEDRETLQVDELLRFAERVELELEPRSEVRLIIDLPPAFKPLSRIAADGGAGACHILGILGVIASGHYALCGIATQVSEMVIGTVGEHRLEDLWERHVILTALRSGLPDRLRGVCESCLMKHHCLGECVAQNFYRTGDLFAPYWFCEQAAENGIFPASRQIGHPLPESRANASWRSD